MVGVEVREEHQRQGVDAQPVQTAVHHADVGPGVDEHALPLSRGQDQGIPLADVAGDDDRVRRRPTAHHLPHRPPEHDQADDRGDGQRPQPPVPPQEPSDGHQQAGEQYCPSGAGRPSSGRVGDRCGQIPYEHPKDYDPITLETGWTVQFNDRSATIVRDGQTREQALPGDLVCRSQVLLLRHSAIEGSADRRKPLRHVVEQVTVKSAWRGGDLTRELVWQLYEIRGLELDLLAVQRWQDPGSAWPAPALPEPIARGVAFRARPTGDLEYAIEDTPPRYGRIELRASR